MLEDETGDGVAALNERINVIDGLKSLPVHDDSLLLKNQIYSNGNAFVEEFVEGKIGRATNPTITGGQRRGGDSSQDHDETGSTQRSFHGKE